MPRLDRAEVPESSPDRTGYVYCLTHLAMPGLVKIGATRKHPIARATELSMGTGVPGAFTVSYYCAVSDAFEVEGAAHEAFKAQRVDEGREFFTCGLAEVTTFIRNYVGGSPPREGGDWIEKGKGARLSGPPTPFADLFVTFPDDYNARALTPEEAAA